MDFFKFIFTLFFSIPFNKVAALLEKEFLFFTKDLVQSQMKSGERMGFGNR